MGDQSKFMKAVRNNNYDEVVRILEHGKDIDVNQPDAQGNTALCVAVQNGNGEVANYLSRYGAVDLNQKCNGVSPVMLAIKNGRTRILQTLLMRPKTVIDPTESLLLYAIDLNNLDAISAILDRIDKGIYINDTYIIGGEETNALIYAIMCKRYDVANALLDRTDIRIDRNTYTILKNHFNNLQNNPNEDAILSGLWVKITKLYDSNKQPRNSISNHLRGINRGHGNEMLNEKGDLPLELNDIIGGFVSKFGKSTRKKRKSRPTVAVSKKVSRRKTRKSRRKTRKSRKSRKSRRKTRKSRKSRKL